MNLIFVDIFPFTPLSAAFLPLQGKCSVFHKETAEGRTRAWATVAHFHDGGWEGSKRREGSSVAGREIVQICTRSALPDFFQSFRIAISMLFPYPILPPLCFTRLYLSITFIKPWLINFPILQSLETNQITELLAKYSAQHELHSEALQRPHPSQTDPSPEQPSWVQA